MEDYKIIGNYNGQDIYLELATNQTYIEKDWSYLVIPTKDEYSELASIIDAALAEKKGKEAKDGK